MSPARALRLSAVIASAVVLSACRVDTAIDLRVDPDGSGKVRVTVTADADVVARAPNIAGDLRLDDLKAVGWKVNGPSSTETGGLEITLERPFDGPAEASAILAQVNGARGPLHDAVLSRSGSDTNSTWTLTGRLEVKGGLETFADDAAIALLGGAPYAEDVAASGLDLGDAVGIVFNARLPGSVDSTTGMNTDGVVSWKVPMDGSATDIATTSTNTDVASSIARVGRYVLYLLLVIWVIGAVALYFMVKRPRGRSPRTPRF